MQELIVLSIAITALIYLAYKFMAKNKSHNCEKCGSEDNKQKTH